MEFRLKYTELLVAALEKNVSEVNRLLIEIEKEAPEPSIENLTCLTKIALAVGSRDIAERYLARLEEKVPCNDDIDLLAIKANLFANQGKYSEALELLDRVLAQNPDNSLFRVSMLLRAECRLLQGDNDQALKDIREMLARNPNDAENILQHNLFLLNLFFIEKLPTHDLPSILEGLQAMRYCENFDELSIEKQQKYMFCRVVLLWLYAARVCMEESDGTIDRTMIEVYQESTIPTESVVLSVTNGEPIHWEIKDPKLITSEEEWILMWSEDIMCDLDFIVYSSFRKNELFKIFYPQVVQARKDIFEMRGDSKRIEEDQLRLQKHLCKIDALNRQEDQMETERRLKQIRNTPVPIREF